jgi:hypothetical protein
MEAFGYASTVFSPTDLRKNRRALDEARKQGASRLRDTDGTSLLIIEERHVQELARAKEINSFVAELFSRLHLLDCHLKAGPLSNSLLGDWRWLSPLDGGDWEDFLDEMWEAGDEARSERSLQPVQDALEAWRETARALGDDERMAALTTPFDAEAFVEIAPDDETANPNSQALAIAE